MDFAGNHHAVLGLGASGQAAARLSKSRGAHPVIFDGASSAKLVTLAQSLNEEGIEVVLGDGWKNRGRKSFDHCIISPGIDPWSEMPQAFAEAGAMLMGELEFAYQAQQTPLPIVAITGTNGKTTTTELTSAFLNAGGLTTLPSGNHGRPLADVVFRNDPIRVHTVEVSSFQLETIQLFRAQVALWMNFAPDHLDRHPDLEAYFSAKTRIFDNQTSEDTAIIKLEDRRPDKLRARVLTFSAYSNEADLTFEGSSIQFNGKSVLNFSSSYLRGRHNVENVMAAGAAAYSLGVPWATMQSALADFRPPRHRCELVATINGRDFINDSKSTNIHSLESCLKALSGPLVLIAGGKEKGLDYTDLTPLIREKVKSVMVIGEIAPKLSRLWSEVSEVTCCDDLQDAVNRGYAAADSGETVLLSPGTSSFDMFTGYDHRGQAFIEAVTSLQQSLC